MTFESYRWMKICFMVLHLPCNYTVARLFIFFVISFIKRRKLNKWMKQMMHANESHFILSFFFMWMNIILLDWNQMAAFHFLTWHEWSLIISYYRRFLLEFFKGSSTFSIMAHSRTNQTTPHNGSNSILCIPLWHLFLEMLWHLNKMKWVLLDCVFFFNNNNWSVHKNVFQLHSFITTETCFWMHLFRIICI